MARFLARAVLAALVVAATIASGGSPAEARDIDTVGGTARTWLGSNRCRGAKLQADRETVLFSFELALSRTAGGRLDFYVYEAATESGTYAIVEHGTASKLGSLGSDFDWESSPPLYAQMRTGNYYVLLACWGKDVLAGYRGEPVVAPQSLAFGTFLGGVNYGASGTPPPGMHWPVATNDYLLRVRSAPGTATVNDTTRPYHGPFEPGPYGKAWGNVYQATQSVDLLGFDQLFHVGPGVVDGLMHWYVYACPRRAGCTKGSPSWHAIGAGTVSVIGRPLNPDQWIGVEGLRLPVDPGTKYWIGFAWADARIRAYRFTSPEVIPSWGRFIAHALAGPLPLASRERFRAVFNSAHPQHLRTRRIEEY